MNPGELLDAAISILPDGAYALLFLVHQDLFESPEDEFVCGRAYGASRVAVVSMALVSTTNKKKSETILGLMLCNSDGANYFAQEEIENTKNNIVT